MLRIISQLLPSICPYCHILHKGKYPICKICKNNLAYIVNACKYCALPIIDNDSAICGVCCKNLPPFDKIYSNYLFINHLRKILHEFKYQEGLHWLKFLGDLIMDTIPKKDYMNTLLIPVPIHKKKLQQRGYNQAAELTKYIGKSYNIPYDLFCCEKIKDLQSQTQLNAQERKHNVLNAFKINKPIYKTHITIIDDLVTTGSTVAELAKTLKNHGALTVNVWCCARATL